MVGDLVESMYEKRPLPIGRTQFNEWADRIIAGSMVEGSPESLRFVLAERLQHIAPTDAFKEDAYFILQLRTIAVKETAFNIFQEIKKERQKLAEDTAPKNPGVVDDGGVLEIQKFQGIK